MEDLEYYQKCIREYREALASERSMLEQNDNMIRLLISNIEDCVSHIEESS